MHQLVEQFFKLKPSKFNGTGDPEAAILWIKELEKAFALLRCSGEDKVILAVYQMQGNTSNWWEATQGKVFPEGTDLAWNAFVKAFNIKSFSDYVWEQKMYEAKFVELSRYAPRLVDEPVEWARRFRDGLKPEIKSQLVPLNLKDYNELYERVQLIERDTAERAAASGS
ncbi:uncharacterized protein LOC115689310 [Syzygium oleosum]|uniref:uncharacterized protein LOC115689310 n=1 Tax=Syzygium oleosum TaxID=219896 RepID=UPI0011D22A59|nr:uncharacterized protein LOC115689310 [Syzygium oleosum]